MRSYMPFKPGSCAVHAVRERRLSGIYMIDKSAKSFEKRDELGRYYKIVRRSFTSALNKERRSMGTNDTALVA